MGSRHEEIITMGEKRSETIPEGVVDVPMCYCGDPCKLVKFHM
jgi:hypothetical protein